MSDERSRPATTPDGPCNYTDTDMVAPTGPAPAGVEDLDVELADRLRERLADYRRRRELASQIRAQYAIARQHGLRSRHSATWQRRGGRR